jgi:hypothetical protein
MATKIQVRRDTAANWTANNPTLSGGEIGFETDTGLFKIGKNNTSWTSLEYSQNSPPAFELDAKIQNFDPATYPSDDDVTNSGDMEIGDVLVLDADTAKSAFKIGDRVRANSVSQREYVFSDLSSSLFNSASANIGDTFTFTTTNPNLAIKVETSLLLYNDTNPIFGSINVLVTSISSNRLTYTCELQYIDKPLVEEVPEDFTTTSWNALFSLGSTPPYHYPSLSGGVFDEGDSLAGVIPYAYLEGIVTGLTEDSISITVDNLGPSNAPSWFENMKIYPAPGRDGLGYGYNIPRSQDDPSFSNTDDVDFQNMSLGQYVNLYKNEPGAYAQGDRVRVVFSSPDAWIEGWVTEVFKDFGGYITVATDDWNKNYTSLEPQSSAKISIIAEPSKSYQLRRRVWKNGLVGYSNTTFSASPTDLPQVQVPFTFYTNGYSLFENGDWIRAEFVDYNGDYGSKYQVYPDTWFEGIVYNKSGSGDSESFSVLITDFRNPNSYSGDEFKTSKIPAPKYTYEFPQQVYTFANGLGYWGLESGYDDLPLVGESTDIYGTVGSYQIGQQIRLQATDEARKIQYAGTYAIAEITGITYEINPLDPGVANDEKLTITILEKNEGETPDSSARFNVSLYASEGAQGPGYEVNWIDGTHPLPDDPQTNWTLEQTTWKVGDQYGIPGDFVNTAYKVGDYVKYLFNTGTYETDHWIEGWITDISTPGAIIRVQRWGNTDWAEVTAQSPGYWRTTYAHFEPGYNFDTYLEENANAVLNDPLDYNYLSGNIQNDPQFYFTLKGHLGSYKAGDYVIVSSRSNPLVKFSAYLAHAGLAGINEYTSTFYPIEILSWGEDLEEVFEDFTLSPTTPKEVGYNFPFPLPNPSVATYDTPAYSPPAAFAALASQTYPLSVGDVVQVRGVTGLYEVGDRVRAYDPYDKDAQFYGEVYSIGSASNEWVSEITVKDPSVFTSSASTSNHNYKIALEERKAPFTPKITSVSYDVNNEYQIQASDMGKTITATGGVSTFIVSNALDVPPGSQVTIIQSGGNSGDVGISGASFIETDGITTGQVQLKGPFGAATLIKLDGSTSNGDEWVVIGNFLSADTP